MRRAAAIAVLALSACGGSPVEDADAAPAATEPTGAAARLAAACSGCHAGPGAAIAGLKGRSGDEIAAALRVYRDESGGGTVMHRLARGYSDADIAAVSAYLAAADGAD